MKRLLSLAVVLLFPVLALAQTSRPTPPSDARVMIISIDGLRPDLLLRANTPRLHKLLDLASFTFWANTTAVAITLPSHTSMLTGFTPNKHGILWNSDLPLSEPVYPARPTLFEVAHNAGYTTAMAAGKSKFVILNRPGSIDWVSITQAQTTRDEDVTDQAVAIIKDHQPQVMFVHLPNVDNVGHADGWATEKQLAAIAAADTCVGRIFDALDGQKLLDKTFVIITADHGGAGLSHGPDDPRSRHIPWIVTGPGIRKNFDLTTNEKLVVNTEDTFATACYVLKLHRRPDLDGKPITAIFDKEELLEPIQR